MRKLMAVRNEKVSNHIPDDLAFSILSKLPLKSLKRFECISKSWALIFEIPHFMSMFRKNFILKNHTYYNDASLLLYQTMTTDQKIVLYSLFGEGFDGRAKLDWPNPFLEDDPVFDILGHSSVNGILGLISYSQLNIRVLLWNPATKEFKVIPPRPFESVPRIKVVVDRHGFGYDCVRDDYKVIQRVKYLPKVVSGIDMLPYGDIYFGHFWEIYSLKSNSWKKIRSDVMTTYECQGVYVDGVCHWWGKVKDTYEQYLVSVDLRNEMFIETHIPSHENDSLGFGSMWSHLVVLSGSIALITTYANMTTSHISILGELGVKESWTKLFTVGAFSYIEYPIAAGKKGNIFFRKKDDELASFDLSTQLIKEHGVIVDIYCCKIVHYKESLLPIGGNT